MTECVNTNAIWVESSPGKEDYFPMESNYGEYIIWDGANCRHGNKVSSESFTRVSFDFRAMKYIHYLEHEKLKNKSIHASVNMVVGEYYDSV